MSSESSSCSSVFDDPEYRNRYRERFLEAQRKGMDMVVYPDGAIALIENKMVMHTYGWHKRRRDFERVKGSSSSSSGAKTRARKGGAVSVKESRDGVVDAPSGEKEYV